MSRRRLRRMLDEAAGEDPITAPAASDAALTDGRLRRLAETEVHHGHIWRVVVADFEAPDGTRFERDVVRSPGAVAVVPVTFDGDGTPMVTLMRQYRATFEGERVEGRAGMRDVPGEPAEETGRRLSEEVGLEAGDCCCSPR
jgi:ADP-ribose pyrophosphatase